MFLALAVLVLIATPARANGLAISNVALTMGETTTTVTFNILWKNAWRDAAVASPTENWDAAWVFAKFSKWSGTAWGNWTHCTLDTAVPGGQPANIQIDVATTPVNGKGAFISRSDIAAGDVSWTAVKLTWRSSTDGVAITDKVKIKLFGIEMVYIPGGSFVVGDLDGPTDTAMINGFYTYGCVVEPCNYSIASEDAINLGPTNGYLWYRNDNANDGDQLAEIIPAGFPKGFAGFYIMKYEITQGQYRDFLNTLTRAQQANRVGSTITSGLTAPANAYIYVMAASTTVQLRNGIRCPATFHATAPIKFSCQLGAVANDTDSGEWVAANYLSWADLNAYADWAALRPITEFEFEKAARGPVAAFNDEFAWGNATQQQATGIDGNTGTKSELPTPDTANLVYGNHVLVRGPLRSGSLAANGGNTRARSGAGYYGTMELSGNVWERAVTPARAAGRSYDGIHGDGALTGTGAADTANWPGLSDALGSGFRGGTWSAGTPIARVSDRDYAALAYSSRLISSGGRCARTFP